MATPPNTRPAAPRDSQGNTITPAFFSVQTFRGDYTGTNLVYRGYAKPGASEDASVWQIAFLTYDGSNNLLSIEWPLDANGNVSTDYEFSWTARASYTFV